MPIDEDVRQVLYRFVEGFRTYNAELATLHASVAVLRREIAAMTDNPLEHEKRICELEDRARVEALAGQGFPEFDALLAMVQSGKKPGEFDS